ncbi:ATP-binding cassette domain-containing protein [Sporolactobacillus shoreae]|uniref:ATP-binding cassette domain-containing protein n=1 Tax=Sporolactobacillus shoreae TaxID=1465501 RepID=A0A4Z0GHY1_9BACL|nr:ATP-binding cassette domain-containing protein [Sporolactobacillus shoreae]TGA96135.1 ATP-binding cassette domain-containing protein [Sporolactobacillus shoreae]
MIKVNHVSFSYPGSNRNALKDVSLTIHENEFVALLGPNGSGKSTLSMFLNGIEIPDQGEVLVDGIKTSDEMHLPAIRRKVQIVFQNPENQQVGITVFEDIAFGLSNIGFPTDQMEEKVHLVLNLVNLNVPLDREVANLSGGEKQKLALASVLALEPEYLILDESTSMLDPFSARYFLTALKQARRKLSFALIYITHHLQEIEEADRVFLFNDGSLLKGCTLEELYQDSTSLEICKLKMPYFRHLGLLIKEQGVDVLKHANELEELGLL